ncbi:hypothetical protein [Nonomuraea sp. NPDC048826]|uniref:hypothetical protein n=1 Tax=Nonomuraea sp. NPDC048826 TaxID=3364347 RepID=UPI00371AF600
MRHSDLVTLRRQARRLARRVGRRGTSLLFVGLVSAVIAWSLVSPPRLGRPNLAHAQLAAIAPLRVWAVLWAITAGICLVQAFFRSDRVAFAAATALTLAWGLIYLAGALTGVNPAGWIGGAVWLGFGGWLTLISTWPETGPAPTEPHGEA